MKICKICNKPHLTEYSRLVARAPGLTGITVEWMKLPTLYTDKEVCHPCFVKMFRKLKRKEVNL